MVPGFAGLIVLIFGNDGELLLGLKRRVRIVFALGSSQAVLLSFGILRRLGRLLFRTFGCLCLFINIAQRLPRIASIVGIRIVLQEIVESELGVCIVVQILAIDLPDREQRVYPVLAARIFTT